LAPVAYYRQYLGITVGGRKLIYINAFHPRVLALRAASRSPESWRTRAMTVCDGGEWFWGAVYDPAAGKLENVQFNGP